MRRAIPRALLLALAATIALPLTGCGLTRDDDQYEWAARATGGTPERGREALKRYGCQSCHTIPGVTGADGLVGPPLAGIGKRVYIAGVLPNTPANLVKWIESPQAVDSLTAMPTLGVSASDARDMASYLYTLR
ncbi:MAG TPA: c-type cytochrome [Gemmatimonadaceae bacterium]|nr:c-type cytochrome [Gemmatimonadaceae bacterium]